MNEAEQTARLRIVETALKFLLRHMPDRELANLTIDHLIETSEGSRELQFLAEEWRQDMEAAQMTIGDATALYVEHQQQRAAVFGYETE